jgi:hypothetical protein
MKLRKLPSKPKSTASAATIENYFKKCAEVQKANRLILNEKKKKDALKKKLAAFKPSKM